MRSTLLFTLIFYCFTFIVLGREIGSFPFGIFIEVFIFLLTVGVIVKTPREDWSNINNSFVFLMLFWFGISVLEVVNPGSNSLAWVAEIRTTAFYPLFLVILG